MRTASQRYTPARCFVADVWEGTNTVRAMMQNASSPSVRQFTLSGLKITRLQPLTSNTNNLTFNPQLILISTSNPTNVSTLTNPDIRSVLDSIPHESRSKRKNQDKGENTPNDPTLNKRKEEVPCRV
jgi:hypothetical protein